MLWTIGEIEMMCQASDSLDINATVPNNAFAAERKKRAPAEKRRYIFKNQKVKMTVLFATPW